MLQPKTLTRVGPTLVRVFLCPCVGPFPSVGLTLTWYMGWNISTLHHILSLYSFWAMKPLTLGAGHLWVLMSPWRMDVKWYMKCFIYWTAEASLRNCLNCVHHCDDHSSLDFISAVQYMKHFIYHFKISYGKQKIGFSLLFPPISSIYLYI